MKKLWAIIDVLVLLCLILLLFSCSKYTVLTKEKYDIIYRDSNQSKIVAKFEKEIDLRLITPDTTITKINKKGVCTFETIKRSIDPIPAESKVRIVNETKNSFKVEFIDYKITLPMYLSNGEFLVLCDRNNVIKGTRYIIKDDNPVLLFKNKSSKSKKNISLKK